MGPKCRPGQVATLSNFGALFIIYTSNYNVVNIQRKKGLENGNQKCFGKKHGLDFIAAISDIIRIRTKNIVNF